MASVEGKEVQQPMRQVVLGSGHKKREGWINIDISPLHRPDILRDLRYGLPFDDLSVDEIHSENFFEHIDGEDVVRLLQECQRVVKVGGNIEIIIPLGIVPDISHKSFYHAHTFENLFQQAEVYSLGKLRVLNKEFKVWPEPYDYKEMKVLIQRMG